MDTILIRKDVQGKNVIFFPDTYNEEKNTISFWDGVHGSQKQETSADYYFTSKPVDMAVVEEMSKAYTSNFGTKQILVRSRLFKKGSKQPQKAPEGLVTTFDKHAFADKLIKALTRAIKENI